jgi:diadenosine tetraphosphate (Ap4A) HIT family hydrolase
MPARKAFDKADYIQKSQNNPCFICEMLEGRRPHHIVYQDDIAVAFLCRYPSQVGYVLVAPIAHLEHVTGDFTPDAYLELQSVIHRVGEAVRKTVPCERLYLLSLGSMQGNRHVHWHIVPCPPGTPYEQQQWNAVTIEDGYLDIPDAEMADLAVRIRATMEDA